MYHLKGCLFFPFLLFFLPPFVPSFLPVLTLYSQGRPGMHYVVQESLKLPIILSLSITNSEIIGVSPYAF